MNSLYKITKIIILIFTIAIMCACNSDDLLDVINDGSARTYGKSEDEARTLKGKSLLSLTGSNGFTYSISIVPSQDGKSGTYTENFSGSGSNYSITGVESGSFTYLGSSSTGTMTLSPQSSTINFNGTSYTGSSADSFIALNDSALSVGFSFFTPSTSTITFTYTGGTYNWDFIYSTSQTSNGSWSSSGTFTES